MVLRIVLVCAALLGLAAAAKATDKGATQKTPAAATESPTKSEAAAAPRHKRRAFRNPYRKDCCGAGEVYRHIYAEAWYGNQKVVAPVRHVGCCDQVQLPTGEWIDCVFTCEITMRKMPLWYWQDQGAGYNKEVTPGYPREDFWIDPWGYKHGYLF